MKVLISCIQGIGDAIHATPLFKILKEQVPRVEIDVVVSSERGLGIAWCGWADDGWFNLVFAPQGVSYDLVIFPRHCKGYDRHPRFKYVLDVPEKTIDGELRPEPCWQTNARFLQAFLMMPPQWTYFEFPPFWHIPEGSYTECEATNPLARESILLNNGSLDSPHWRRKRWPAENWEALFSELRGRGELVCTVGRDEDWAGVYVPGWVGRFQHDNLNVLASGMKRCKAIISTDSGLGQLASVVAPHKTITMHGPTAYQHSYLGQYLVSHAMKCDTQPCQRECVRESDGYKRMAECPLDGACMRGITPERVLSTLDEILETKDA